jgi:chromosomal replication initiation ATPase DnaA
VVFRELGMALTAKLTKQSLNEIGRLFGGLDHSTVLSGKRAMASSSRARRNDAGLSLGRNLLAPGIC